MSVGRKQVQVFVIMLDDSDFFWGVGVGGGRNITSHTINMKINLKEVTVHKKSVIQNM